jgi:RNA polymerase sigma-70 factor (ECF subfamily)
MVPPADTSDPVVPTTAPPHLPVRQVPEPAAAAAASAARFDALYTDYHAFVWRCLRNMGVADEAMEDAAQEVFLVVHRQMDRFEGRSSVKTWLFGIANNVMRNHRRSTRRTDARVGGLAAEPRPVAAGPLEHAQEQQAARFVQEFLATIDDKKRDVFLLAVLEQMSVPDVAEALSIPLNTAYTRLRAARADFQRALDDIARKS